MVEPPERGQADYGISSSEGSDCECPKAAGRFGWQCTAIRAGSADIQIGTYPPLSLADAREEARKALARVQTGTDVAEVKQSSRQGDTFGELVERYMTEHAAVKNKPGTLRKKEAGQGAFPMGGSQGGRHHAA